MVFAAAALAASACGGGGGGGGGSSGGDLSALADQAQQFVATHSNRLRQSKGELVQKLNEAQDAAHRLSNEIEDVDVPPELINVRADLGLAMRTITLDIGRIRGEVEAGDIAGAQAALANLRSLQALEDAIAAVKNAG
jgi:hypothetical protein